MQDQVIVSADLQETAKGATEQDGEIAPLLFRRYCLELVRMVLGHDPGLKRHARCVGAEGVVVSDIVHDSLGLANLLAEDVTEDAAVAVAIPIPRGAKLVEDAARHEGSGR